MAQRGVVKNFDLQQQGRALRVKQAAVKQRNVDVARALVQHFKQALERIHTVVQVAVRAVLLGQALKKLAQAEAVVKRVAR